jgi:hypothetical protein
MKLLIGFMVLGFVSAAQAQDLKFGDLNYFLKSGQINAGADLSIGNESLKRENTGDVRVNGYFADAKVAYGVLDNLTGFVKLQYQYEVDTELKTGSGSFDTTGLQNPEFGANYRLLNQSSFGYNVDFGAVVGLKLMDRKAGSLTSQEDGDLLDPALSTRGEPRHKVELNGRLGKKWNEANEFSILAGVIYHQETDYEDKGNNGDATIESSMDLKAGGYYQYRPVNEFMLGLGLTGIYVGEAKGKNGAKVKATATSHFDFQASFDAKYLVTEALIVKFMMNQDRRSDFEFQTNSGDSNIEKRKSFNYGLGIDYLF